MKLSRQAADILNAVTDRYLAKLSEKERFQILNDTANACSLPKEAQTILSISS
jgi:hypothetical protein